MTCPCDNQCHEECDLCRDKDTMEKAKQRYDRKLVTAMREKACDMCGKEIRTGEIYIYESWIGKETIVESRNYHRECEG